MEKNNTRGFKTWVRRGVASGALLAILATQAIPLTQVSASTLDYNYGVEEVYKTANTAQYVIDIKPMIAVGQVGGAKQMAPQGGTYNVQRIARYTLDGKRFDVTEPAQTVTLTPNDDNKIKVAGDGEYKITPVGRIPGFLKDLGATEKHSATDESEVVEAQGHYIYAFPLITSGVPSSGQVVDFKPKLREARADLEITKLGDDQKTPLQGVTFAVYQKRDAQLGTTYEDGAKKIGTAVTNGTGKATYTNLIEGDYYFVEEGAVPDRYLPDTRKVEFSVKVAEDGEKVTLEATDAKDFATEGNNVRGSYTVSGKISRVNYIDPVQNKEETFQAVKGNYDKGENTTKGQATGANSGIVYVNTTGQVDYSSTIDIPKNFNDFEVFSSVDTIDNKLALKADSVELRVVGDDGGVLGTYKVGDLGEDFKIDGQKITINAKGSNLATHLEADGVDYVVLTYKADVNTKAIAEGVQYDTLKTSQAITADSEMKDTANPSKTTTHETAIRVQEGKIVVDKEASDGAHTPLKDAEFQLYRPVVGEEVGEISNGGIQWVKASNPRTDANYHGATDVEGQLEFGNLPYGEYLIVETKAPEGYRLNNSPTRVTLTAENEALAFDGTSNKVISTIENMRRSQIFPGTGTTGNIITLVALVAAGSSLVFVTVKKRKGTEVKEETTEA